MLHQSCPKGLSGQTVAGEVPEIPLELHPHGHCHPPSFNKDHLFSQILFPKYEQTLYDAERCVCWLESTKSPSVHCGHQSSPLHLFLSLFWEEGHSLLQCFAAFSAQFPTVGRTDLCSLDLAEFSEEHMANEESAPSLATALSGGCPRPPHQSWALEEPSPLLGCPTPGTAASHCATP